MTNRTRGTLLVLTCVALWALIPVVAKTGQASLDNHQFLFWSSLISFVALAAVSAATGRIKEVRQYSLRDWLHLSALGLLGKYIYYLLLYLGYSETSGMEVLVFQYLWPILIVAFSLMILKERVTVRRMTALGLGFVGVIIVLTRGQFQSIQLDDPGVITLVATGAACFALFSVLSKRVKKDALTVVAVYFLAACVASLISMLSFSTFALPNANELMPVILNGLIVNGFSYVLWMLALKSTDASYLAPYTFITPVLSALYLVVFFDEPFLVAHMLGLLCIVTGGLVNSVPFGRTRM